MIISPHIKNEYIKPESDYENTLGNPFVFPLNLDDSGIDAINEMILLCDFLFANKGKAATLMNYTKELEKFSQWLWRIKRVKLLTITKEEALEYIIFIQSPPYHWIAKDGGHSKFIGDEMNPLWRPFSTRKGIEYAPSFQSNRATISCLKVFYNRLITMNKTNINPFALIKNPIGKVN
jgi:site-specific recombinase XerD